MNFKNGKVFTSKFVGTGPWSCEKRIYRAAVSQRLRNTGLVDNVSMLSMTQIIHCRMVACIINDEPG